MDNILNIEIKADTSAVDHAKKLAEQLRAALDIINTKGIPFTAQVKMATPRLGDMHEIPEAVMPLSRQPNGFLSVMPAAEVKYKTQHKAYVDYLLMNVKRADWHAVADAANDLRVLEAQNSKVQS